MKKFLAIIIMTTTLSNTTLFAESDSEGGCSVDMNIDLTTANIWRGSYLCGLSAQPSATLTIGGLSAGMWASTDLNNGDNGYTEIDFSLGYTLSAFTLTLTDYCWTADNGFDYCGKYNKNHYLEIGASISLSEFIDELNITFGINTMMAGACRNADDDAAYSTFLSLDYEHTVGYVRLSAGIGASVEEKDVNFYSDKDGFRVVDLHASASRDISVGEHCGISLGTTLTYNPTAKKMMFAASAGLSF